MGSVSRGAVQTTIERFTFPHKYKKVRADKSHDRMLITLRHKLLDVLTLGLMASSFCLCVI